MSEQKMPAGLYVVATPIGNLADMTFRAVEILKRCSLILCEDTRVSARLFAHYDIRTPTQSYNDHNGAERRPDILKRIQSGEHVALVSDAGTPLVSDPGYKLVRAVQEAGCYVTALPGASSVLMGLCLSGLPSDRFFFAGFLPAKAEAAKAEIAALSSVPATLIFFESAQRLAKTLHALAEVLGDRPAAVVREITKLFEESRRGALSELCDHYSAHPTKGEVVVVVGAPDKAHASYDIDSALRVLLSDHGIKEAAAIVAEQSGKSRKDIYARAVELKRDDDNQ